MTFDLNQILASKRSYRRALAARDIGEKLRMLDALRQRTLTLRAARPTTSDAHELREKPPPYRIRG